MIIKSAEISCLFGNDAFSTAIIVRQKKAGQGDFARCPAKFIQIITLSVIMPVIFHRMGSSGLLEHTFTVYQIALAVYAVRVTGI